MTNRRKSPVPKPEELATMELMGTLQNVAQNVLLGNHTVPDLAGPYLVAEVEPIRRWQYGLAQLLEYWDFTLRSTHPVYIIIRDNSPDTPARDARIERLCASIGVRLWIWDTYLHKWTRGGTAAQPTRPPSSPLLTLDGREWTAPTRALRAYRTKAEPYATWMRTYRARRGA